MPLSNEQIKEAANNLFNAEKEKRKIGLLSVLYKILIWKMLIKYKMLLWKKKSNPG